MSVVIGVKCKDGVILAADKQSTGGNIKYNTAKKLKKFKYSNTGIGSVGASRNGNLLQIMEEIVNHRDILEKVDIDFNYVVGHTIPNLISHFKLHKRIREDQGTERIDSNFIFATSDRIFLIDGDFCVIEPDQNFITTGCGEDMARGFLAPVAERMKTMNTEQAVDILQDAIIRGCEADAFINSEVDILILKKREINYKGVEV